VLLSHIRDRAKSWVAAAIVGILTLSFALWGIQYYTSRHSRGVIVAKVGGAKITQTDLNITYKYLRNQWFNQMGKTHRFTDDVQAGLRQAALNHMIERLVMMNRINTLNLYIDSGFLDQVIAQIPGFQDSTGRFSFSRFQALLLHMGLTSAHFVKDLRQDLLINQWQQGILNSAFILPGEFKQVLTVLSQRRSVRYLHLSVAKLAESMTVSDAMARQYYEAHKNQFKTPEKVQLDYVRLSSKVLASKLTITEQDLKTFYANNVDLYTETAPDTKAGQTGTTTTLKPFKKVREQVKQALVAQETEQQFSDMAEQLADLSYTHPDSLVPVSQALQLTVQTTPWLTGESVKYDQSMITAAFSESVLKDRNNSQPITLNDGSLVVIRVKAYQPSSVLPFDKVKKQVIQAQRKQLAQAKVKHLADSVINAIRLDQPKPIKAVKQYRLRWKKAYRLKPQTLTPAEWFSQTSDIAGQLHKDEETVLSQRVLSRVAFSVNPKSKQPAITPYALSNGDYLVVQLLKLQSQHESFPKTKVRDALNKRWVKSIGTLEYVLYKKALITQSSKTIYLKSYGRLPVNH